ncbi:Probable RNA-directed DNA polymerase from transposon X-element [Eumeta japonica]|uniref:Probable RNA-directed DNA polymerase from transposon X-element n=1 Tax=Eumeta variegata TaxID=151549 RepID=A0A4C1U0Y2_EUMVA|nr:Probable RNA-directed DNA polymerase from transposon X-element [Eumeta japonica]
MHVEVMYGMDTQHLPILVTIGSGTSNSPPISVRQRVDWKSFELSLETLHLGSSFETAADVEASANLLVEKIKEAQARATTLLPSSTSRRGDLPLSIKRKLRLKRRLHKLWTRTRCPKLKKELNGLSRNISEAVRDFRGANWEATIDRAGESAKNLNQLCHQLTRAAAPKCPITDRSGVWRYDAKARAEVIAEHLAEQFTPNPPATSPSLQEHHAQVRCRVEEFMATALPAPGRPVHHPSRTPQDYHTSPQKESPGTGGVSTAALRHLPRRAIVAMNRVFNGILRTGHFPEECKRGKIITIPKTGKDPRKPENIRPITLLSHVAKTFERALLTKLRLFLTPRQEQYGFREGHSTSLQLIRVLHYLASERNCERYTVAVLLDMEKAFDRFLRRRRRRTIRPTPERAGVPQGSCLSPELYAVYTDDIPMLHGHLEDWEDDVMLALYADDSAYFASSRRADLAAKKIQRVLDLLPEWLDKWRMAVNVSKTAALLTGSQRNMPDQLRLRGQAVEWNTRVRYLGVHIDRSLRMTPQVDHVIQTSRAARAKLRPILASRLPISTKVAIYKCYIRSRLTYAAPAWYALCSGLQRQRLQAQQNIALRLIAGAGWCVRNDVIARDLGVDTIEEFVRRLTRRAFNRADASPYPSLHNLAPLLDRPTRGYQLPRDLVTETHDDEKV